MKDYDWFSTAEESEPVVLRSGLTKTEAEAMAEEKVKSWE